MDGRRCRATTGSDTLDTVHLWTQVIGKIRMVQSPWINHSWSVTLYVSPRGLRTSLVPYGSEGFEWAFDFVEHHVDLTTTRGQHRTIPLVPMTVADFYAMVLDAMDAVGMPVTINPMPNEIADAIPFHDDTVHAAYQPDHIHAWWRAALQSTRVFTRFRAGYWGKASPVHFFWGGFDLAVTRFSGRTAPPHAGGVPNFPDDVAREAYSHEVTSAGFWPGDACCSDAHLLRLRLPDAGGLRRGGRQPTGGVLAGRARRVRAAVRRRGHCRRSGCVPDVVPRVDPRRRRRPRRMGSGSARVRLSARPRLVADPSQPSVMGLLSVEIASQRAIATDRRRAGRRRPALGDERRPRHRG